MHIPPDVSVIADYPQDYKIVQILREGNIVITLSLFLACHQAVASATFSMHICAKVLTASSAQSA